MSTSTKTPEETLEEKLDRLNSALKNTVQGLDSSFTSKRNPSPSSFLNSKTTSFCLFDTFEQEVRSVQVFEENIENMLRSLDRAQMQTEDFWSDSVRSEEKLRKFKIIENLNKTQLEKRLADLDILMKSLTDEQNTLKNLGKNLKVKETELRNREKKIKAIESRSNLTSNESESKNLNDFSHKKCRHLGILQEINFHENEQSQSDSLVQELRLKVKLLEELLGETKNSSQRTKILKEIATAKNEIHMIRAESVVKACAKGKENPGSSKVPEKPNDNKTFKNIENISFTPSSLSRSKKFDF